MKNSTYLYILGLLCFIAGIFIEFQLMFLCGCIFSAAQIVTKTLEDYFDTQKNL